MVHVFHGHKRVVWSVAFSRLDRIVASASGDATVRIWSVQSGTMLRTLQEHVARVLRVRFISRGTQLVSGGADGLVKVWATRTGGVMSVLDLMSPHYQSCSLVPRHLILVEYGQWMP